MLILIVAVAAVVTVSGGLLVVLLIRETRRAYAFDRRLAVSRAEALKLGPQAAADATGPGETDRVFAEFTLAAVRAVSLLAPFGAKERAKLAMMLRTAGIRHTDAVPIYLCVKVVLALVAGAAASLVAVRTGVLGSHLALAGFLFLAGAIVGGLLPELVIRNRNASRTREMAEALPSALDLLVMCLEAGLTFERALLTTAEELEASEPKLASELRVLEAELRVGSDHRTVLEDFQRRTAVAGLRDLATTLLQSERYGTPLTQSMRNIAEGERLQRAARVEEQAQRLPVILTLPMMLLVLPGTMLLMAGPAFLQALQAMKSVG